MKIKEATDIKGMVWFEDSNVKIAGVYGFSFMKVMRLMFEARMAEEEKVYTLEALQTMLKLNRTDVENLKRLDIDEAEVFDDCAVIKISANLYITEQINIQYNYNLFENGMTDEEYVDNLLAEQERFNRMIYGCDTSDKVAEEAYEE